LESGKDLEIVIDSPGALSPITALADIPEEEVWLAKQKSARTLLRGCEMRTVARGADKERLDDLGQEQQRQNY
jgi:hypothetical protein